VVHLGNDADGEPISSCVVARNTNAIFKKPEPTGKAQKLAFNLIKQLLTQSNDFNKCNSGSQTRCLKTEDAINMVASTLSAVASNKRNNRARTIIQSLIDGSFFGTGIESDEGWLWLS
jgi:hypothetical protein